MQLWLVRHARPLVEPGICYGALDVHADPHATALAATELAATVPIGSFVMHSPLQRCELLAQSFVGLRPDLASNPEPNLREMNFGAWEGQRWDHIAKAELQDWTDDFANYRCGGTGESTAQIIQRVHRALLSCIQNNVRLDHCATHVWITHAGVMRAALWLHQRGAATLGAQPLCPRADEWPRLALDSGQVLKLDWPDQA
jgi:alpha-ribazole phosphatase